MHQALTVPKITPQVKFKSKSKLAKSDIRCFNSEVKNHKSRKLILDIKEKVPFIFASIYIAINHPNAVNRKM